MSFDRTDFDSERAKSAPRQDRQTLTMLQQQAVKADLLTGDPAWDTFQSFLQNALNVAANQRDRFTEKLRDPQLVNPDAVAQYRIAAIRFNERVEVLSTVLTLPSEIKRIGSIAAEKLKTLTELEGVES